MLSTFTVIGMFRITVWGPFQQGPSNSFWWGPIHTKFPDLWVWVVSGSNIWRCRVSSKWVKAVLGSSVKPEQV